MSPARISSSTDRTLSDYLESIIPSDDRTSLRTSVIPALLDSVSKVAEVLRASQEVTLAGTANTFGDDQLNVDVLAEDCIREAIASCPTILTASSEEDPVEKPSRENSLHGEDLDAEKYTVAFDPLDGSSIIAPNWTVGTIIGIWDGATALNQPAEKQIAAILGVIGPRTTAIVAVRIPGGISACFEVGFSNDGIIGWKVIRPEVRFSPPPYKTRYFAPANLRAAAEDTKYMALVTDLIQKKYTLRYSGGLIPDVVHALVKGQGIYISPVTSISKPKLRRLYELFPVALVVECAGGDAVDPADGERILDRALLDTDERAGLVCGTREEVVLVKKALVG